MKRKNRQASDVDVEDDRRKPSREWMSKISETVTSGLPIITTTGQVIRAKTVKDTSDNCSVDNNKDEDDGENEGIGEDSEIEKKSGKKKKNKDDSSKSITEHIIKTPKKITRTLVFVKKTQLERDTMQRHIAEVCNAITTDPVNALKRKGPKLPNTLKTKGKTLSKIKNGDAIDAIDNNTNDDYGDNDRFYMSDLLEIMMSTEDIEEFEMAFFQVHV
jgi:hypothetical protein